MTSKMNDKFRRLWKMHWKNSIILMCFSFLNVYAATSQKVTGNVVDDMKLPLPGVTVMVKGDNTKGTITDMDGNYSISVNDINSDVLIYSFIGMDNVEETIAGRTTIKVKMVSTTTALDEVVAIGYGTAKRKDLTASVASVKGDEISQIPVASPAEAMAGRMAGVRITTADGSPDAEILIRVRGGGSITQNSSPYVIIDGFPGELSDVAPSDIESIDVLKDASATSIYGSNGAAGVIIVTTKSAKAGKTKVEYNGYVQIKQLANKLDVLDSYEYVMANYELAALGGDDDIDSFEKKFGIYEDLELYKYQEGTDWQENMFGSDVLSQNHNLKVSGGTEKTRYSVNAAYLKNGGLMANNDYQRKNLSLKINHEIADNLKFSFSTFIIDDETNGSGTSGDSYKIRTIDALARGPVRGLEEFTRINPGELSDEEYEDYLRSNMTLEELAKDYWRNRTGKKIRLNAGIDWEIIQGLSYKIEGGYTFSHKEDRKYWGQYTTNASYVGGKPLAQWKKSSDNDYRMFHTLTYKFQLNDIHDLSLMAGQEVLNKETQSNTMDGWGYPLDLSPERIFAGVGNAETSQVGSAYSRPYHSLSYFSRLNYSLKGRYLFQFTARRDGSTKFISGNNIGYFPSGSLGWRISDEPFMSFSNQWLSNLKFRASYGEVGMDRVADGTFVKSYKINTRKAYGPGDQLSPYYMQSNPELVNEDLVWETTITANLGLDFGFFNERLSGTVEVYENSSKDLIVKRLINAPGAERVYENLGKTSNKGIEGTLNAAIIQRADFSLSANFNVAYNTSKVERLAHGINLQEEASGWASTDNKGYYDYRVEVGEPIGLIYGWETDGYYSADDFDSYNSAKEEYILKDDQPNVGFLGGAAGVRPGTIKFKDQITEDTDGDGVADSGDGVIDDRDRKVIGSALPKFTGGFGLNATWKGIDASVMFSYVLGNDVYNANKIATTQAYRKSSANLLNMMSVDNRYTYLDRSSGEIVTDLETLKQMNEVGANKKELWTPYSFGRAVIVPHSWAIEDGSFLRLQNVSIGYTIPKTFTQKFHCEKFRVYATANNLWVLTNYSGYDPEVNSPARGSSSAALTPGLDYSTYPKSLSWTFGVNVSF